MSIPNVSIIMPIYNAADFLHESLGGLLKQTLTDIEIICVNDGSTDNSLDIIKEYAYNDSRIKIINKSNSGYGNTMNLGLKWLLENISGYWNQMTLRILKCLKNYI